jgi:hypothetical protein
MGYSLRSLKKNAYSYELGIFTWPVILNTTGACYLLRYGDNTIKAGQYYYFPNGNSGSPVSNDGYKVLASEAKALSKLFRGYVAVKRAILEDWDKLSEEQQKWYETINKDAKPPCSDFLDKIEKLADFCEQSGGFRIY